MIAGAAHARAAMRRHERGFPSRWPPSCVSRVLVNRIIRSQTTGSTAREMLSVSNPSSTRVKVMELPRRQVEDLMTNGHNMIEAMVA